MKQEPTAVTMAGIYKLLDMELSDINADIIRVQENAAAEMISETADGILDELRRIFREMQDVWIYGDGSDQDPETIHACLTEIYRSGSRKGQEMDLKGNVIYAVDFDGTLSFGRFPGVGDPNDNLFRFLKAEKERGARLILNTCRTGDDLAVAVEYCRDHGLEFEFVNENLPELIELYGGDTRKINADFYIDDKAVNPIAGHFTVVPAGFNFKKE